MKKAVEIVKAGCNVILDWGFWTKAERQEKREKKRKDQKDKTPKDYSGSSRNLCVY